MSDAVLRWLSVAARKWLVRCCVEKWLSATVFKWLPVDVLKWISVVVWRWFLGRGFIGCEEVVICCHLERIISCVWKRILIEIVAGCPMCCNSWSYNPSKGSAWFQ